MDLKTWEKITYRVSQYWGSCISHVSQYRGYRLEHKASFYQAVNHRVSLASKKLVLWDSTKSAHGVRETFSERENPQRKPKITFKSKQSMGLSKFIAKGLPAAWDVI